MASGQLQHARIGTSFIRGRPGSCMSRAPRTGQHRIAPIRVPGPQERLGRMANLCGWPALNSPEVAAKVWTIVGLARSWCLTDGSSRLDVLPLLVATDAPSLFFGHDRRRFKTPKPHDSRASRGCGARVPGGCLPSRQGAHRGPGLSARAAS